VLLAAGLALAGCAGNSPAPKPAPTASTAVPHDVTFQVTGHGSATLTWIGGAAKHVRLPWQQDLHSPLGADGLTLTVQLDPAGGQANCAIAVDGRRVVSSLAQGPNGHATCHTGGAAQVDD
jgi:hypothetical protein